MFVRVLLFFVKQKTAYELRISDWSSDVCSSDLRLRLAQRIEEQFGLQRAVGDLDEIHLVAVLQPVERGIDVGLAADLDRAFPERRDPLDLRSRRSEERRVGKECVSQWSSRWSPYH